MTTPKKTTLHLSIDIEQCEQLDRDTIARIFYPNEGNVIKITKGLNAIELSTTIHHEIGHLLDWYLSGQKQTGSTEQREENAEIIGEAIRWKKSNKEQRKDK